MRTDDRLHFEGAVDGVGSGGEFFGLVASGVFISNGAVPFSVALGEVVALGGFRQRLLALFTFLATVQRAAASAPQQLLLSG